MAFLTSKDAETFGKEFWKLSQSIKHKTHLGHAQVQSFCDEMQQQCNALLSTNFVIPFRNARFDAIPDSINSHIRTLLFNARRCQTLLLKKEPTVWHSLYHGNTYHLNNRKIGGVLQEFTSRVILDATSIRAIIRKQSLITDPQFYTDRYLPYEDALCQSYDFLDKPQVSTPTKQTALLHEARYKWPAVEPIMQGSVYEYARTHWLLLNNIASQLPSEKL
jgi:hypothetical protein